jgi:hypothetical protein
MRTKVIVFLRVVYSRLFANVNKPPQPRPGYRGGTGLSCVHLAEPEGVASPMPGEDASYSRPATLEGFHSRDGGSL